MLQPPSEKFPHGRAVSAAIRYAASIKSNVRQARVVREAVTNDNAREPILPLTSAGLGGVAEEAVQRRDHRAPSPIAPPTRLTEPERTSPTANTPGTAFPARTPAAPSAPRDCAPVSTKPSAIEPSRRSRRASRSSDRRRRTGTGVRMSALSSSRRRPAAPAHALTPSRRPRARRSRSRSQVDVRRGRDAVDQIFRHAVAEVAAADQQDALRGVAGRETPPPAPPSCRRRPAPLPRCRHSSASIGEAQ